MLLNGLYEQVINQAIETELARTDRGSRTAPIDGAEASRVLAKYVAEVVEKGLENLKDSGGDLHAQVALANRLISAVTDETKEEDFDTLSVAGRAEQLLALFEKKNSVLALDEKAELVRPESSIARSSLFTGALHEPQMYTELKKEIVSCDRIDMLVSFMISADKREHSAAMVNCEVKAKTENAANRPARTRGLAPPKRDVKIY